MDVHDLLRRFEDLRQVDGVAATIAGAVRKPLRKTGANAALRGKWLGHPLHPLMVTVPIGPSWAPRCSTCLPGTGTRRGN